MTNPTASPDQRIKELKSLNSIFARASVGDFSENVALPQTDDELMEFYVGVQVMLDVIREKIEASSLIKQQLEGEIATKNHLVQELRTERNNLRQYHSRNEAILSSIGEGLIVTNRQGRITMINEAAQQMLGITAAAVLGKTVTRVISLHDEHNRAIPAKQRPISQVLTSGIIISNMDTYYYQRADKTSLPISFTTTPLMEDKKVTGAVILFRDVSREKEVDDAKNEFISLASHQLRTPLTVIEWYMERLQQGGAGELTPKQMKYVQEVYAASRRMATLVQSLLNVSRLELGTFALEEKMINVIQLAHTVVMEFGPSITERGQKLTERYARDIPQLCVDPKVLYVVLQNLIANAVKYTPPGGKISVKIALQSKTQRARPDHLIVSVVDNGLGIPVSQQAEIFKKLFRADNIKELDTDGNGLGLYITKSILDVAGGQIWFESKEGKGSSFYVLLPLTRSTSSGSS